LEAEGTDAVRAVKEIDEMKRNFSRTSCRFAGIVLFLLAGFSALRSDPPPPPTEANVHYGPDAMQVLDFWKAPSDKPTPVVFCIHGGGWMGGTKAWLDMTYPVDRFRAAGISVVSIEYRHIKPLLRGIDKVSAITPERVAHNDPPVLAPLSDAARALQFVRSRAAEWNIDKARIGLAGGSAGGCSSLWLAFHKDMADPKSADLIARESTRPWCVALMEPQTTLDPKKMEEWSPNSTYGADAFGFAELPPAPNQQGTNLKDQRVQFEQFLAVRSIILPWIKLYSPYSLMTADAPPIYLSYSKDAPAYGKDRVDPTHSANFGGILMEKAKPLGLEVEFNYLGAPNIAHKTVGDYLLWKLKAPTQFMAKK
jgi:acetyl esterase/lipase